MCALGTGRSGEDGLEGRTTALFCFFQAVLLLWDFGTQVTLFSLPTSHRGKVTVTGNPQNPLLSPSQLSRQLFFRH